VYDAIDEGDRAYVVREWVDGASLRELAAEGPFEAERAAGVAAAVADAVAAVHATGMAHGNIHPGTVLVAADGRVVLTDARSDEATTPEADIRAIGAVLYCALTAYWPHAEAGPTAVPDGVRDSNGVLATPRQVRSGVPTALDELTMQVLNPTLAPPAADTLLGELSKFEHDTTDNQMFARSGTLGPLGAFDRSTVADEPHRPAGRKIAIGVAALLVIAVVGVFGASRALPSSNGGGSKGGGPAATGTAAPQHTANNQSTALKLAGNQARIVDPSGNRGDVKDADKTVDGNNGTGWRTSHYNGTNFGGLKKGMGVLLDLGSPKVVQYVNVQLSAPGTTIELRTGDSDPGTAGDSTFPEAYQPVGEPKVDAPPTVVLGGSDKPVRYLLVWLSKIPPDPADPGGRALIVVQEITVFVG
jgi:hypothetical protein